ncbi:tyrosine-protein phosphatase [Latilactobacillus graminis]|nr:tyrosine-protein phosphatase [Latilactobacillus graminis]QFP80244.1 tyrosine-protein phosphatase [Latilactobacillus graminis]
MISRILPIKKGYNFRELGDYQTLDGRRIKQQRLFRTGHLAQLDKHDLMLLARYPITQVVDFRSPLERKQAPDKKIATATYESIPIFKEDATQSMATEVELYERYTNNPLGGQQQMRQVYRDMVQDPYSILKYRQFFERLLTEAHPEQAFLFHCTGGKDRTGMAAYYLLNVLGVPAATIRYDYLLSNTASREHVAARIKALRQKDASSGFLKSMHALMSVDQSYLQAAEILIDQEYGSTQGFIRHALGLTHSDIEQLRAIYLE